MKTSAITLLLVAAMKAIVLPDLNLLVFMGYAMIADLLTGIAKAIVKKEARTSSGYRKTIIKAIQYMGAIACGILLASITDHPIMEKVHKYVFYLNDGLVSFIIFIEVTSIFENLYECDKKSAFSRFFVHPVLKVLTFQIRNNPVVRYSEADKAEDKTNAL